MQTGRVVAHHYPRSCGSFATRGRSLRRRRHASCSLYPLSLSLRALWRGICLRELTPLNPCLLNLCESVTSQSRSVLLVVQNRGEEARGKGVQCLGLFTTTLQSAVLPSSTTWSAGHNVRIWHHSTETAFKFLISIRCCHYNLFYNPLHYLCPRRAPSIPREEHRSHRLSHTACTP